MSLADGIRECLDTNEPVLELPRWQVRAMDCRQPSRLGDAKLLSDDMAVLLIELRIIGTVPKISGTCRVDEQINEGR